MKYVRFSGGNGYCGCDYEEYVMFDDDCPEDEIENYSIELAYQHAESFEYVESSWDSDFEDENDREMYYENALSYCGWDYCSEEEFNENK